MLDDVGEDFYFETVFERETFTSNFLLILFYFGDTKTSSMLTCCLDAHVWCSFPQFQSSEPFLLFTYDHQETEALPVSSGMCHQVGVENTPDRWLMNAILLLLSQFGYFQLELCVWELNSLVQREMLERNPNGLKVKLQLIVTPIPERLLIWNLCRKSQVSLTRIKQPSDCGTTRPWKRTSYLLFSNHSHPFIVFTPCSCSQLLENQTFF